MLEIKAIYGMVNYVAKWLELNLFTLSALIQLLIIGAVGWLAHITAQRISTWINSYYQKRFKKPLVALFGLSLKEVFFLVSLVLLLGFSVLVANEAGWSNNILRITASLVAAWGLIRITSGIIENSMWSKFVAMIIWLIASLHILGFLDPTIELFAKISFSVGKFKLSILNLLKGVIAFAILFWLAQFLNRVTARRLKRSTGIAPSQKVLFLKIQKIVVVVLVIGIGLNIMGIDVVALTVFSGAVGFGIAFGLQKVFSNLISGIILILDKSIKPGDVIAIGDTYGWVKALEARYVSIVTRDGKEHLIPNENIITQPVENWSFSDNNVRIHVTVGVSYKSDIHKARELTQLVAEHHDRVLENPAPRCLLEAFGDSSIIFSLRVWIADPVEGTDNVRSDLLLAIWDKFKEHGIEIPFPQRDLHLKTIQTLNTALNASPANTAHS